MTETNYHLPTVEYRELALTLCLDNQLYVMAILIAPMYGETTLN